MIVLSLMSCVHDNPSVDMSSHAINVAPSLDDIARGVWGGQRGGEPGIKTEA